MKVYGKSRPRLEAGVHLVSIADLKYARDKHGNLRGTKNGELGLEIIFKNKENHSISGIFWLSDEASWLITNLCKAIGIPYEGNGQISANNILRKKLFITVANEYLIENGNRKKDTIGNDIYYPKLMTKFYPVVDPKIKPIIEGDPERNNGIASGEFVIERFVTPTEI